MFQSLRMWGEREIFIIMVATPLISHCYYLCNHMEAVVNLVNFRSY